MGRSGGSTVYFRPTLQSLIIEASEVKRFFRLSHTSQRALKRFSAVFVKQ